MLLSRRLALQSSLATALAGCSSQGPFRKPPSTTLCSIDRPPGSQPYAGGVKCEEYSLAELRRTKDDLRNYTFGVVEFDDQGEMLDPRQFDSLFKEVERLGHNNDLAIIVYVHGWYNNAAPLNHDVINFRGILEALSFVEELRIPSHLLCSPDAAIAPDDQKRHVVGIFAAWPGLWSDLPGIGTLSFPTRKEAAQRVAQGSIRELFARARDVHKNVKGPKDVRGRYSRDPRLVFVGHSFGAQILYQAVEQYFIDSAVVTEDKEETLVEPYGNLVILINPAFEGVRYEPVHRIVKNRKHFSKEQQPVLISFASRSDYPVRYFFPAGRFLTTIGQQTRATSPKQREEILQGVGYVDHFQTHTLDLDNTANDKYQHFMTRDDAEEKLCYERKQAEAFKYCWQKDGMLMPGWQRRYTLGAKLAHIKRKPDDPLWTAANNPFWMVSVDGNLVPGHSAIWENERWLDFLRQLYVDIVAYKEAPFQATAKQQMETVKSE